MVMMMPPYHGALLKGNANQTFEQFRKVSEAGITIMVQDAPLSGVDLSVDLLVKMAKEIEHVKCFKIECAQAANKLRALIDKGGSAIEGPFDGEEGITLFADLEAGAKGNMSSAMLPDLIGPLVKNYITGNKKEAENEYNMLCEQLQSDISDKEEEKIKTEKKRKNFVFENQVFVIFVIFFMPR